MFKHYKELLPVLSLILFGHMVSFGQDASDPFPNGRERPRDEQIKTIKDLLAKQVAERDKKDHADMLKRGEEALAISSQLEKSFETNNQLSPQDQKKLASLEKIVLKIRNELGGDDDGEEDTNGQADKPSTLKEAFGILRSTTIMLAAELKKTSRFSISAVAIQTSNSVIKTVRFLRLRN